MPLDLKVLPVFHTPLVLAHLPHVDNKGLADIVYSLRDAGLLTEMLAQMGLPNVLQMVGWAVLGRPGDMSLDKPHNHLPYHFSAVYYPKVPALQAPAGNIVFFDPRETFAGGQPVQLPPQEGMMVLFPSWLKHSVVPHNAADDRISISLNATIGTLSAAQNYPPHRGKRHQPGSAAPQEFDPASPEQFDYPADA
jgi:hypothetical protein